MPGVITPEAGSRQAATIALRQFIARLAEETGLREDVIAAWVRAEGAYTPQGVGHFNYLNVRTGQRERGYSGVGLAGHTSSGFAQFRDLGDAIRETAHWINSMSNYRGIRASANKSAAEQLAAIARSPWDAGHYGGNGSKLLAAFKAVKDQGFQFGDVAELPGKIAGGIAGAAGDAIGGAAGAVVDPIAGAVKGAAETILEGLLRLIVAGLVLGLAAALFYAGTRRLAGDRLPSATDLAMLAATRGAGGAGARARAA